MGFAKSCLDMLPVFREKLIQHVKQTICSERQMMDNLPE